MFEPDVEEGELIAGHVHIVKVIQTDGTTRTDVYCADDSDLSVEETVGMLAMAQHMVMCERED